MPQISIYPPGELSEENPAPEFLMVHTRPRQIWIETDHYIETDTRRASPGKVYLFPEPNHLFRVVDILEAEESVTEYQVEDARDTVVIEYLYDLNGKSSVIDFNEEDDSDAGTYPPGTEYGGDCESTVENQTETMLRYQIETPEALSMGDVAMIPFESIGERDASELRDEFQTSINEHR